MANHLHLLLQPPQGRDLPRIMQWIGWYSAMALNRLTRRCGHFWEARYFSTPIDPGDTRRVLPTLRTIHANQKAAGVRKGFQDPYRNYGHYERLVGDGLSEWHPSFLQLAPTLGGMCQALCPVLPALPAKGEAGPQLLLGQQAAATGWGQWRQGRGPQGSGPRRRGRQLLQLGRQLLEAHPSS